MVNACSTMRSPSTIAHSVRVLLLSAITFMVVAGLPLTRLFHEFAVAAARELLAAVLGALEVLVV